MFKRSNKLAPPPKPPTAEQILEDLNTFKLDDPHFSPVRDISEEKLVETSEWWKLFQTFIKDVDDLNQLKLRLEGLKSDLETADLEIKRTSTDIKQQINDHLEKLNSDIPDDIK